MQVMQVLNIIVIVLGLLICDCVMLLRFFKVKASWRDFLTVV